MKLLVQVSRIVGFIVSVPIGAIVIALWISGIPDGDFSRFDLKLFLVALGIGVILIGPSEILKELKRGRKSNES